MTTLKIQKLGITFIDNEIGLYSIEDKWCRALTSAEKKLSKLFKIEYGDSEREPCPCNYFPLIRLSDESCTCKPRALVVDKSELQCNLFPKEHDGSNIVLENRKVTIDLRTRKVTIE